MVKVFEQTTKITSGGNGLSAEAQRIEDECPAVAEEYGNLMPECVAAGQRLLHDALGPFLALAQRYDDLVPTPVVAHLIQIAARHGQNEALHFIPKLSDIVVLPDSELARRREKTAILIEKNFGPSAEETWRMTNGLNYACSSCKYG